MHTIKTSLLILGDNLQALKDLIPDASVDLIYMDPPFNTRRNYPLKIVTKRKPPIEVSENFKIKELKKGYTTSFTDNWNWDLETEENFKVLTSSSSNIGRALKSFETILGKSGLLAYLTMLTPRVMELKRVLRETGSLYIHCDQRVSAHIKILLDCIFGSSNYLNTIVWCYGLGGSSRRYWPRKHDDILWYAQKHNLHYFKPVLIQATSQRMKGMLKKTPDYWLIPTVNNMAKERVGFPTQKPLYLLERIVISSSPENGIILDPFCGSGTTLVAAEIHHRTWVGIEQNKMTIEITKLRLKNLKPQPSYSYLELTN